MESKPHSRDQGSQGEIPSVTFADRSASVGGYHEFSIKKTLLGKPRFQSAVKEKDKFAMVRRSLLRNSRSSTVLDLGCSSGFNGLRSATAGFSQVTFLDHDRQYLDIVEELLSWLGQTGNIQHQKIASFSRPHDIVFAFAIIHWIYRDTESFGSIDASISFLAGLTRRELYLEWVAPEDPAIRDYGHLRTEDGAEPEDYTFDAFETATKAHFSEMKLIAQISPTRSIWKCTRS